MAGFRHMVDMERSDEEKAASRMENMYPPALPDMPDVPPGLCICLTEAELEKLDLDDDAEIGDLLHLMCMAKVTSISKQDTGNGPKCRIELAIVMMSVENEDTEDEDEDDD
jgi:hypothetical protein